MTTPPSNANNTATQIQNINQTLQNMQSEIDYLKDAVNMLSNIVISLGRERKIENPSYLMSLLSSVNASSNIHHLNLKNFISTEIKKL